MATAQSGNRTLRIPTEGCSRGKGQLAHIKHFENKLVSIVIKRLIKVLCCHWRELPQVSLLLQQTPVATKHIFCCDKIIFVTIYIQTHFVATNVCLSLQNYVCRDKTDTCDSSYQWYWAAKPTLRKTQAKMMLFLLCLFTPPPFFSSAVHTSWYFGFFSRLFERCLSCGQKW